MQTRKIYGDGVRAFLRWCEAMGRPPVLGRPTVNAFVSDLLDGGAEAATARSRQLAVRPFSAWLAEEGEIPDDLLANLRPPRLDHKVVQELDNDQCRLLIKVPAAHGGALRPVRSAGLSAQTAHACARRCRDEALGLGTGTALRLELIDGRGQSGMRLGEALAVPLQGLP